MSKRKARLLLGAYALIAVTALGCWAAARSAYWGEQRRAAGYSAARAFEETVGAVEGLSEALAKSLYATDGGMCARICGEAYACAGTAEGAMLALPFDTQELEQLSAFLNRAGDFAISLCPAAAERGFTEEETAQLRALSAAAADFADSLRQLRSDLNAGEVRMDRREKRLQNVGEEPGVPLSARLLDYQAGITPPEPFSYDGRYGCEKTETAGYLTEEEMAAQAADFAGVAPEALDLLYRYEGAAGRRCFRAGELLVCVSRRGVESMSQTRLVSEARLSEAQARQIAGDWLAARGFEGLSPAGQENRGTVLALRYCRQLDGADCPDNALRVAVALDDGSIYSFNAEDYCAEDAKVSWNVDQESAAAALPRNLSVRETRRVIVKSEGKRDTPCYVFFCQDEEGRGVSVYVEAVKGKQFRIEL